MIDPVVQRITNKDGSIDAKQMIQELITARDRIRDLEAELADWKRMRNEAMAVATSNRERINTLEAALRSVMAAGFSQDSTYKIAARALATAERDAK